MRKPEKPTVAEETAKVLAIFYILRDETARQGIEIADDVLMTVADRIAYRCDG